MKPATSFEFVEKWFEVAAKEADRLGRHESASLWRDGLAHLQHLNNENRVLTTLVIKYKPLGKITSEDRKWAQGVLKSLKNSKRNDE